uniref:Uncharacterized protein n=1 Tax=Setaria digitata TaxID=48799 RepID=A0A915PY06_9BILA
MLHDVQKDVERTSMRLQIHTIYWVVEDTFVFRSHTFKYVNEAEEKNALQIKQEENGPSFSCLNKITFLGTQYSCPDGHLLSVPEVTPSSGNEKRQQQAVTDHIDSLNEMEKEASTETL